MLNRERKDTMTREASSQDGTVSTVPDGQLTAENRSLEVGDVSFVYRRFGSDHTAAPALVMLQHFRGNLDSWDAALVDRLAHDREVILLDNRGVGGSTGVVPENVTPMARDALAFIDALGLKQVDLLGFSLGRYVAQELVLLRPRLVRRLVLAGTAPQGGPDLHRWSEHVYALATPDEPTAEDLLGLLFSSSEQSQAKGMESIGRLFQREVDRDEPTDLETRDAQLAAITAWGIPDTSRLNRLAGITQPTLVATATTIG
jgi:pimeloyl-ACP methyl ester carboxylesterase